MYDLTFQILAKSIIVTDNTYSNGHVKLSICDFCILYYLRSIFVTTIYVKNRAHNCYDYRCF